MFHVEANSKQIPWLHGPVVYSYDKYNSLVDGLVLFGLGNDDLPAHCQIWSVRSSFISTPADLLIALFVVTVRTSNFGRVVRVWSQRQQAHLREGNCPSLLRVWYILFYELESHKEAI